MSQSNKRKLKRIIEKIDTTILAWADNTRIVKPFKVGTANHLPPLYQVMAYKGEAILLERFFGVVRARLGVAVSDEHWLMFYNDVVLSGGYVLDFISRCHWLSVLSQGAPLPEIGTSEARQLYCILLAVLSENNPEKISLAVDEYFIHIWKQRFPSDVTTQKSSDTSQLKHKLTLKIRRLRSLPCEVKESFVQSEGVVTFRLLYRDGKHEPWQELTVMERPRLKLARLAAYEYLLEEGGLEAYFNPAVMTLKKKKTYVNQDGVAVIKE